jgi:hypothetical protein
MATSISTQQLIKFLVLKQQALGLLESTLLDLLEQQDLPDQLVLLVQWLAQQVLQDLLVQPDQLALQEQQG